MPRSLTSRGHLVTFLLATGKLPQTQQPADWPECKQVYKLQTANVQLLAEICLHLYHPMLDIRLFKSADIGIGLNK